MNKEIKERQTQKKKDEEALIYGTLNSEPQQFNGNKPQSCNTDCP